MHKNYSDHQLDLLFQEANAQDFGGREDRLEHLIDYLDRTQNQKPPVPRFRLVPVLAAALVLTLTVTTIAFADSIQVLLNRISGSGFQAVQVEELVSSYDGAILDTTVLYENAEHLALTEKDLQNADLGTETFTDIGQAQACLPFPLAQPEYLPKDCALEDMVLHTVGEGLYLENILFRYAMGEGSSIAMTQQYVGPDCTLEVQTRNKISTVYIAGNEALCIVDGEHTSLYWTAGNYAFSVSGSIGVDELVAVAESISIAK